jgi:hypothetical protein
VRDRAGRAWPQEAKAAVRALDSGAARNRSGVWEAAPSEGRSVTTGETLPHPGARSRVPEACPGIRPHQSPGWCGGSRSGP